MTASAAIRAARAARDAQFAIDAHPQVAGAVHHDQRNAQHASDERERVEQLPEVPE